jgi:predicted aspartyl protease
MKQAALGLLLCALPLAPAFAADCKTLQLVASIPLVPANDKRAELVPVKLNGTEKKLLLDTGGYMSQISQHVVDELKLPVGGSAFDLQGLTGKQKGAAASIADFEMGTVRAHGTALQIMPDDAMGEAGLNGLIAIDMFLPYDLDLDFGHDKMNFISSDHCDGKVVYWPSEVQAEVPMRIVHGHYLINVTLDGRHLVALLDTGASNTAMGLDIAAQYYGLTPSSPGVEAGAKVNLTIQGYHYKFDTLSFDGIDIHTPTITLMQSQMLGNRQASLGSRLSRTEDVQDHFDMILGMDIMRHLHIYIATKERKVYITPA